MSNKFIDSLVISLNTNCLNKNTPSFVEWSIKDINLDFTKCRPHCTLLSGYVWNGTQLCESCNKILHENLDSLNKSPFEMALDLKNANEMIKMLTTQITNITNKFDNNIIELKNNLNDNNQNFSENITDIYETINNNKNEFNNNLKSEKYYIDTINKKLDEFINVFDKKIEIIIEKKNNLNNNLNNFNNNFNNNLINNNNFEKYANIKIFDKYKVGGVGYILSLNTISSGKVKCNYTYANKKQTVIFTIKSFENNFCPTQFEYPDNNIQIVAKFIKGDFNMIELYDEFYFIEC
jgi:hypothetical protein